MKSIALKTALLGTMFITILLPQASFCEEEKEKPKSVFEQQSAYAMPAEKPSLNAPNLNAAQFANYINRIDPTSRYCNREPTREDFEKVPLYRGYYTVNDKKEEIEEKLSEGVNRSEWKDKIGIEKISTKFNQGDVKLQARFKENQNRQKSVWTRVNYEGNIETGFTIRF